MKVTRERKQVLRVALELNDFRALARGELVGHEMSEGDEKTQVQIRLVSPASVTEVRLDPEWMNR
jgi:hypothetical protein